MLQLKETKELEGRTIKSVFHLWYDGTVTIVFTDDTYLHITAGQDYDGDLEITLLDEPSMSTKETAGIITPEQYAATMQAEAEEHQRRAEWHEREQYRKLKAKFESGGQS